MSTLHHQDWQAPSPTPQTQGLNRPMAWIGVMLLAMLVAVGLARWSGLDPRTPDAAVQWQRDLQFRDVAGGDIAVLDHRTGQQVAQFSGEQGFLRSTLRALARERHRESLSGDAPFLLASSAVLMVWTAVAFMGFSGAGSIGFNGFAVGQGAHASIPGGVVCGVAAAASPS